MTEYGSLPSGVSLDTVIFYTPNMEALATFYREAFDIGPFQELPGHLGCQVGPVYLGFDQVEEGEGWGENGVTLWFTVDDLEASFQRLIDLGASVRYPPTEKPWGARLASLHDPDGNIIGISQRR